MDILISAVLALVALCIAVYAQRKIPAFTKSGKRILLTRTILVVTGIAFGFATSFYTTQAAQKIIIFVAAFGMVHVPEAVILFVKSRRGEAKS
jgi:hypothetical protein